MSSAFAPRKFSLKLRIRKLKPTVSLTNPISCYSISGCCKCRACFVFTYRAIFVLRLSTTRDIYRKRVQEIWPGCCYFLTCTTRSNPCLSGSDPTAFITLCTKRARLVLHVIYTTHADHFKILSFFRAYIYPASR